MTDISMICAGIDVAKDHLDIAIHPGGASLRVTYDAQGLSQLDTFLDENGVARVGFEASGGYEWRLLVHLRSRTWPCARLQPVQLRAFAKSRLTRIKNDQFDALLIAAFTASLEHLPDLPQARFDKLLAELTYLEQIEQQIALIKTFAETAHMPDIRQRHALEILRLRSCRKDQLLHIEKALRQDAELARRLDLIISIKGIGLRSALGLVIRMPEMGSASRAEIAALAGVAPYDDDSGKRHGKRHIAGGRERLRKTLYMCAFTASRHNKDMAVFYERLRQTGKEHRCAVIAVARKLIIMANTVVTRNTPWTPLYRSR